MIEISWSMVVLLVILLILLGALGVSILAGFIVNGHGIDRGI